MPRRTRNLILRLVDALGGAAVAPLVFVMLPTIIVAHLATAPLWLPVLQVLVFAMVWAAIAKALRG